MLILNKCLGPVWDGTNFAQGKNLELFSNARRDHWTISGPERLFKRMVWPFLPLYLLCRKGFRTFFLLKRAFGPILDETTYTPGREKLPLMVSKRLQNGKHWVAILAMSLCRTRLLCRTFWFSNLIPDICYTGEYLSSSLLRMLHRLYSEFWPVGLWIQLGFCHSSCYQ